MVAAYNFIILVNFNTLNLSLLMVLNLHLPFVPCKRTTERSLG